MDISTAAPSTASLPVLVFLPRCGSGPKEQDVGLLPLQSPMPAISPSLPVPQDPSKATPQQRSIRWKQKKSYDAAEPCVLGMHRKMPLRFWGSSGRPCCATPQRVTGAGSPSTPLSPTSTSRRRYLRQFGLNEGKGCAGLVGQEGFPAWCSGGKARTGWGCRELPRARLWPLSLSLFPPLVPGNALLAPEEQRLPAGHHHPNATSSRRQQNQSPSPPRAHLAGKEPPVQTPGADPSRSHPTGSKPEQDARAGAQMQQILFQIIWLLAVGGLAVGWVQL